MTDRLERELDELLGKLYAEQEPSSTQLEGITVACLYHKADKRDWKRLEQHFAALQWQIRQRVSLTWTSDEGNPTEPSHIERIIQAIENAHIVIVGLSVDMQLLLQREEHLYEALLKKLEQVRQTGRVWGQPPFIAGIRMKASLWHDSDGIELLPRYQKILAGQQKDEACVEIAYQIREWIDEILSERDHQ